MLLKRMLGEQTDHDDNDFDDLDDLDDIDHDNIEPKDGKDLDYDILQNASDPDATFRQKYEANIGYSANVLEFFDDDNSVIKCYDFKPNIYADHGSHERWRIYPPRKRADISSAGEYLSK